MYAIIEMNNDIDKADVQYEFEKMEREREKLKNKTKRS